MSAEIKKIIRIYGIVQGVGFRPFVKRKAMEYGISGTVMNKGSFVEIEAIGQERRVLDFYDSIRECPPERAVILRTEDFDGDTGTGEGRQGFFIIEGAEADRRLKDSGMSITAEKLIPPDIGICKKCEKELFDKKDRRYLHPFINCTQCGPRFTILQGFPYDRERTSMAGFKMCPECHREYYDPESRRFDAQPVCCNECGPEVFIPGSALRGLKAVTEVRKVIKEGGIAAVKGIGGFHLCCDAANDLAVRLLRDRKKRPFKPFAVMLRDLDSVKRECVFDKAEEALLIGYEKPIVLLKKKKGGRIAEEVAPGNPFIGVMLPYAPLQLLLFSLEDGTGDFPNALVMTSGNVSGAPVLIDNDEAYESLKGYADIFLSHDRDILTRADDSVIRIFQGEPLMIRRSRGYAPLPFILRESGGHNVIPDETGDLKTAISEEETDIKNSTVLAVGADLKNSFCIRTGNAFYPSAYVGDMGDIRSGEALISGIERMEELLTVKPDLIVSDLHPGYESVRLAEELSHKYGVPHIKVQHHYAHILSVMAENSFTDPVIGAAFDGTGYGTDGTVWGGEIMKADIKGFKRLSHIKPFKQPPGDVSAAEGWRIAVSMIHSVFPGEVSSVIEELKLCSREEEGALCAVVQSSFGTILSSSAGRLFDAVSAVLGIKKCSTFEGEASSALEFAAERFLESLQENEKNGLMEEGELLLDSLGEKPGLKDTDLLFREICIRTLKGEDREKLSFLFHHVFSALAVSDIKRGCEENGIYTAALSGGCFQNLLLLSLIKKGLEDNGIKVLINRMVPPNDGGISLGQCILKPYPPGRSG